VDATLDPEATEVREGEEEEAEDMAIAGTMHLIHGL
jgi:hypothetical protein